MRKRKLFCVLTLLLGLGTMGVYGTDTPKDDVALKWEKLAKKRILPGVWVSQSRNMCWGIHLKEIRRTLEKAAFDQAVKIVLILDGGMKLDLGSYQPDENKEGNKKVGWSTIPNLKEFYEDVRITSGQMYPLQFFDQANEKRVTIRVQVIREGQFRQGEF
jgi:hypothetical protein